MLNPAVIAPGLKALDRIEDGEMLFPFGLKGSRRRKTFSRLIVDHAGARFHDQPGRGKWDDERQVPVVMQKEIRKLVFAAPGSCWGRRAEAGVEGRS